MITVMFASYNGGERLRRMLDSLTHVRCPSGGWRLIAIDNRSSDETHSIMLGYGDVLPIDVDQEPQPGKNRALNRAVDMAMASGEADLFIFCDDDVLVSADWLVEWRTVADAHQDYEAFAGLTLPHWPFEPPAWISSLVPTSIVYGFHHESMREGNCDIRLMHGTNMAVRASIFRAGCRFNACIGPNGSPHYAMGSETDLALRLAERSCKCWFAERPAVRHIIRPEQMEAEWILGRAYRFGRGLALLGEPHGAPISFTKLVAKNRIKALVFPWLTQAGNFAEAWQRRWRWAYDQGFEDGTLERQGKPRHWRRN